MVCNSRWHFFSLQIFCWGVFQIMLYCTARETSIVQSVRASEPHKQNVKHAMLCVECNAAENVERCKYFNPPLATSETWRDMVRSAANSSQYHVRLSYSWQLSVYLMKTWLSAFNCLFQPPRRRRQRHGRAAPVRWTPSFSVSVASV